MTGVLRLSIFESFRAIGEKMEFLSHIKHGFWNKTISSHLNGRGMYVYVYLYTRQREKEGQYRCKEKTVCVLQKNIVIMNSEYSVIERRKEKKSYHLYFLNKRSLGKNAL